jgi:hypothetical protein
VTLPGETIATGAPHVCTECLRPVKGPMVLLSGAGYFVGYGGCFCGPVYSRESGYYRTPQLASAALADGTYER